MAKLSSVIIRTLLLVSLFVATSCSTTNHNNQAANQVKEEEKTSSQNKKIDTKKLAKEAGYMIGWDIIWATACKSGLHLSVGICLAVDTIGDVGIIAYSNFESQESKEIAKEKIPNQKEAEIAEPKENHSFEPLELVMSVSLMAIILILI